MDLLRVSLKGPGQASWRSRGQLPGGRDRFEGRTRTQDLVTSPNDRTMGLGLRISGMNGKNRLVGTTEWQTLPFEFSLEDDSEVESVAEIRGQKGTGWFAPSSLRLVRLP